MTSRYRTAFACAFIVIGLPLVAQEPGRVVDPEAYALYEQLLVPIWKDLIWPHGMPLLLQRETVELEGCELPQSVPDDWRPVVASFLQANRERKWLQPTRMSIPSQASVDVIISNCVINLSEWFTVRSRALGVPDLEPRLVPSMKDRITATLHTTGESAWKAST